MFIAVKLATILIILFISGCTQNDFYVVDYSDHILGKKAQYTNMPFSLEAQLIDLYEKEKANFEAKKYLYSSDGYDVEGYLISSVSFSKAPKGLLIYIRGGFREYGRFSIDSWLWLKPLLNQGFHLLASQYRYNPMALDNKEFLDQYGGEEVRDIDKLIQIYKKQFSLDIPIYTLSWGSRGGIQTYRFLEKTKFSIEKSIIIEGASNFALLEKERGDKFFSFLDQEQKDARDLKNINFRPHNFLLIHSKKNKKTSLQHAKEAYSLLKEKAHKIELLIQEEINTRNPEFTQYILEYVE